MVEMRARMHTAEHIMFALLRKHYPTLVSTSLTLGEDKSRYCYKLETGVIKEAELHLIEEEINEKIEQGIETSILFMPRKDAQKLCTSDLFRLVPSDEKEIRLLKIGDFNTEACIGNHVKNTKEIGHFRFLKSEKIGKDTFRLDFSVGDIVKTKKIEKIEPDEKELQLAKGVRDFPPEEKILRDKIINTIKETLEIYGYNPIELPILERLETLSAKYAAGEESDALKEIFVAEDNGGRKLGLRFDLTVPFSRFMGINPDLKMPFKKYITGQVFRDGPLKKGRYREFTQFDPDIVGCSDVIADAETIAATDAVFKKLGFDITIEFNDRKVLFGIMKDLEIPEKKEFEVIIAIDKLKKIGNSGVEKELLEKGYDKKKIEKLLDYLKTEKSSVETLANLKKHIKSDIGKEGLKEIEDLIRYLKEYGVHTASFLPSLARGLAYYTGPIYEVFLKDSTITSSAAGGGRYDELIGKLQGTNKIIPATGISYGIEVMVEAMKEKQKLEVKTVCKVYVIPIKTKEKSISIVQKLRHAGIKTDFDFVERGISKNLDYANSMGIPYVIFVGEKELSEKKVKLRDMKTGNESMMSVEEAIKKLL